jgi:serine-type D-Ala-D-Ala carboxypeptidase
MQFERAREVLRRGQIVGIFPCSVAEIGRQTGPLETLVIGRLTYDPGSPAATRDTIFDLASLTKVLVGATLSMTLLDAGRLDIEEPVGERLTDWRGDDRRHVTVRDLLEHCSGLPGHRPYYRHLQGRRAFEQAIVDEPLEYVPRTQSMYSDLGFMLLGFMLEDVGTAPLSRQVDCWRDSALGPQFTLRYGPLAPEGLAPTEQDAWRGRVLQGEVHDENAAALDGIAAHAGLFGTAAAVGAAARWWLRLLFGTAAGSISPSTARRFTERSSVPGSSRALGWDTMLPTSSCGTRLSTRAIGHTGFTGTSLWIDPEQDLYVVLLTNRVHPTRDRDGIQNVRRAFHDAVVDDLSV